MFSNNAAGLKSKVDSFKNELKELKVSVFTIQETHFSKKRKIKMENYEILRQ